VRGGPWRADAEEPPACLRARLRYCILSKEFVDDGNGHVAGVKTMKLEWAKGPNGRWNMTEVRLARPAHARTRRAAPARPRRPRTGLADATPPPAPAVQIEGSERTYECDYVFLAMGFLGPQQVS
jgi:NADPH-dependent glutamate synthase beta subunit-like oxidoreductase